MSGLPPLCASAARPALVAQFALQGQAVILSFLHRLQRPRVPLIYYFWCTGLLGGGLAARQPGGCPLDDSGKFGWHFGVGAARGTAARAALARRWTGVRARLTV